MRSLLPSAGCFRFWGVLQLIPRALDLAEHVMIARIDPLVASRHALVAGGELARVLFPNFEGIEFFFTREIAIVDQFIGVA